MSRYRTKSWRAFDPTRAGVGQPAGAGVPVGTRAAVVSIARPAVKVRILGDVAIIHARTLYTTASGERRSGRYTDVWARRQGSWLAVSAHVTR